MKAEFTSRDGGCLYEDLTQLQNILEENHVTDINILKYAVEYAAEQNCLRNRVQCRLYDISKMLSGYRSKRKRDNR